MIFVRAKDLLCPTKVGLQRQQRLFSRHTTDYFTCSKITLFQALGDGIYKTVHGTVKVVPFVYKKNKSNFLLLDPLHSSIKMQYNGIRQKDRQEIGMRMFAV